MEHGLDILKLVFDGTAVGAVITIVIIFLNYQKEYNKSISTITTDFTTRVNAMQESFQNQVEKLSNNFLANERAYQIQIQKLFEDFILISRETITAVKELESAVREMKNELVKESKRKP